MSHSTLPTELKHRWWGSAPQHRKSAEQKEATLRGLKSHQLSWSAPHRVLKATVQGCQLTPHCPILTPSPGESRSNVLARYIRRNLHKSSFREIRNLEFSVPLVMQVKPWQACQALHGPCPDQQQRGHGSGDSAACRCHPIPASTADTAHAGACISLSNGSERKP